MRGEKTGKKGKPLRKWKKEKEEKIDLERSQLTGNKHTKRQHRERILKLKRICAN